MGHEGHRPTRCARAAFQPVLKIVEIMKPSGNSYGSFVITYVLKQMYVLALAMEQLLSSRSWIKATLMVIYV